jgi:hypothetical protein
MNKKNSYHATYRVFVWILFIVFVSAIPLFAQQDSSKKIQHSLGFCESIAQKGHTSKAIECFQKIQSQTPTAKISLRLAEIFYKIKDSIMVSAYIKEAIVLDGEMNHQALMNFCNKLISKGDEKQALAIMTLMENSTKSKTQKQLIETKKQSLVLKSFMDNSPVSGVELKNLGTKINTPEHEYLPSTSLDGKTMIFTRNVQGNEDFFISLKDSNDSWITAQNLGYPPNTNLPDGGAKLSGDGHYLFYTRCDLRSPNGIVGGGCDIAFSFKENGVWSSPEYFGYTINTTAYEGQPCLSFDNADLYFVSDRTGGFGGKDIWVSHFKNRFWGEPENLGSAINTNGDETSPFIHADNETLYFSSDGHPSIGKSDLFVSRKNSNNGWRKPINLGAPINTKNHDGSMIVSANGKIGYCTSERPNGYGGLDLYAFNLYDAIQPIPTLCYQGFIEDKFTYEKIKNLDVQFFNYPSMQHLGKQISNAGDASFAQALQRNKMFFIHIEANGYRDFNKIIDLKNDPISDVIEKKIRLRQPGIIDTLYKTTLMFRQHEMKLESASIQRLDSVLKSWKTWQEDSAKITILLKGHYYCCDSLTDTFYLKRLQTCQNQLNHVSQIFNNRKISCDWVMQDFDMIIYNDDEDLLNEIELTVIENY